MSVISPTDLPRLDGEIDNTRERPGTRAPLFTGPDRLGAVTDLVATIPLQRTPMAWYFAFAFALGLLALFGLTIGYLVLTGVGVWGNNNTVNWAFGIVQIATDGAVAPFGSAAPTDVSLNNLSFSVL